MSSATWGSQPCLIPLIPSDVAVANKASFSATACQKLHLLLFGSLACVAGLHAVQQPRGAPRWSWRVAFIDANGPRCHLSLQKAPLACLPACAKKNGTQANSCLSRSSAESGKSYTAMGKGCIFNEGGVAEPDAEWQPRDESHPDNCIWIGIPAEVRLLKSPDSPLTGGRLTLVDGCISSSDSRSCSQSTSH